VTWQISGSLYSAVLPRAGCTAAVCFCHHYSVADKNLFTLLLYVQRVDQALSTLIKLQVSLFIAGELDQLTFKGPFQLKRFYVSMTISFADSCDITTYLFSLGLKDDKDLKFLLKGSQLLKVKSSSWRKERFYKLQEDCKTIWQESKKMLRSPDSQICK